MQQLNVTFTPASGGPTRPLLLRIGDPVKGERSWSVLIEILGFDKPHAATCKGEDWAQVLELSAMVLPYALEGKVREAGGGTLDPPFYERDARNLTEMPEKIRAVLDAPLQHHTEPK